MKRYIKYGLIILAAIAVVGIIFYMLKKPKESVLKKVPASVSFCFTIDKEQFFEGSASFENMKHDSFFNKFKSSIPSQATMIFNTIGINPFGDMALFGKHGEINLAWTGNNRKAMLDTIKKYKWPIRKFKEYEEVKILPTLYLSYNWPVILLSNYPLKENEDFFGTTAPKIKTEALIHPKTENSIVYGFMFPDNDLLNNFNWIPLKGKAYIGLKIMDENVEICYVQPGVKLSGKLGPPRRKPAGYALMSWPLSLKDVSGIKQIPAPIISNFNQLIKKPVSHLYAEVLDTISSSERIITYDMDIEFQLTQKITDAYKTFPGLNFEFVKTIPDKDTFSVAAATGTNIGLDIFKLYFNEKPGSYIITSETRPGGSINEYPEKEKLPRYYLFANFELLKTDPFWKTFTQTNFKTMQVFADSIREGFDVYNEIRAGLKTLWFYSK